MSKLYIVGTPIGNLGDLSSRAKEVLNSVDFVAAEDTRVSSKLVKKPMVSYYDRQKGQKDVAEKIIEKIKAGETCALVTDAGMPAISDPGCDLVKLAIENKVDIEVIPGPTAFVTALVLSGLPTDEFTFIGFLPSKPSDRKKKLKELKNERRTLIFYEAPHRIKESLADFAEIFGSSRPASLSRELTKLHEETLRMSLGELRDFYSSATPRGEYVLVVSGAKEEQKSYTEDEAIQLAKSLQEKDNLPPSLAAKEAAKITNIPKALIYKSLIK